MKTILRKLLKESSIYSLQPTFEKLIAFVLLPIYTTYLSTADYGLLQYITTIGAFLFLIMSGGLETSFWKFRSDGSHCAKKDVALNVLLTQFLIGLFLLIPIYFLKDIMFDSKTGLLVLLYIVGRVIYVVYQNLLLVLRANHKAGSYVLITTLYALLLAGVNIYFVAYMKLNYSGIIYGNLIINVIFSFLLVFFIKEFSGRVNFKLSADMLKYGAPLILGNIAAVVISLSDRFFLKAYSTDSELGLYSFGYQFANLVLVFLVTPLFMGWNPIRWEIYEMDNAKEVFSKIYKLLLFVLPIVALIIVSLSILVGVFIVNNKEYLTGFSIITTIAFSHVFYALYYFNAMGMLFDNKTKMISLVILSAAFLNLILNFLLIPKFGMIGAALATLASYFTMFSMASFFCQKYYPFKKSMISEASLTIFIVAISCITIIFFKNNILTTSMFSLFVFSSSGIIIMLNVFTREIRISDFAKLKELFLLKK